MPSTVADARDLLIASVLCKDPVLYIDDRWLYDQEAYLSPIVELTLKDQKPKILHQGNDVTIVGSGHSTYLACKAGEQLKNLNILPEIIDIRILNPLYINDVIKSVKKTGKLVVVDHGCLSSGFSAELVAKVVENLEINCLSRPPIRIALPDAPAPTARVLEKEYYTSVEHIVSEVRKLF
jgi:pyruvate dehydrogenase E1 component beta subunit